MEGISIEKIEDYEGTTQINGWTIRVIVDQELKSKFSYAYAKSVDFHQLSFQCSMAFFMGGKVK